MTRNTDNALALARVWHRVGGTPTGSNQGCLYRKSSEKHIIDALKTEIKWKTFLELVGNIIANITRLYNHIVSLDGNGKRIVHNHDCAKYLVQKHIKALCHSLEPLAGSIGRLLISTTIGWTKAATALQ